MNNEPPYRPLIVVQVLNHNNEEYTKKCLNSLLENDYNNYLVLLIDNGSLLESYMKLKNKFKNKKRIEFLRIENNIGFTGGHNFGVTYILKNFLHAKYILVLDNDTYLDSNVISRLVNFAEKHPGYGVIGPKICYYDDPNIVFSTGSKITPNRLMTKQLNNNKPSKDVRGLYEPDYIQGCCMLIRKDLLKNGFLDEKLFTYWEETDFQFRLKNQGYKIICIADVAVYHKKGATSNKNLHRKIFFNLRNRIIFYKRWNKNLFFPIYFFFYEIPRSTGIYLIKKRSLKLLKFYYLGFIDGIFNKFYRIIK